MQIVIPMSGTGRRFMEAGYKNPKPLIVVDGKPIIEYVVDMFPGENDFLFICNGDHLRETHLRETLERIKPTGNIVEIEPHKLGPVYAVMAAAEHVKDDEPVVVNYCDFNQVWDYADFKKMTEETDCDGSIPCYIGFHPHLLGPNTYASCKLDSDGWLLEIREKHSFTENKMDCPQSSGTYYFKSGAIMKKYFQMLMDEKIELNGEYYSSLPYNLLVRDGLKVNIYEVEKFCQWGTPQDLKEYNYWSDYFHKKLK